MDVQPEQLQSFLRTAELLHIKGLADQNLCSGTNDSETLSVSPNSESHEVQIAATEEDNKLIDSPNAVPQIQGLCHGISCPTVSVQHPRSQSSATCLTPHPLQNNPITQSTIANSSNCENGKLISTSQPCIKVPVPPTPHFSNLKRNNFTNLAQYLSGSTNYQSVTSPSSPPSPAHEENIDVKNVGGSGGGSIAKRRKVCNCIIYIVSTNNSFIKLCIT